MNRRRRLGTVLLLAGVAVLGAALPASAHAILEASTPVAGGTVSAAPSQVTLTYDEPVGIDAGSVQVLDATGKRVDDGDTRHGKTGDEVVITLHPGLTKGTYVVSWRAISADSHPVSGAFSFGVGVVPDASAATRLGTRAGSPLVGWIDGTGRLATEAGMVLLIGVALFLVLLWPEGGLRAGPRRVLLSGWILTASSAVVLLLIEGPYGGGLGVGATFRGPVLSETMHSQYGHLLILRLILLALAVPLLRGVAGGNPPVGRATRAELAVLGAGVAYTLAASGHAGTGSWTWLATTTLTFHIVAVCAWLGGLVLLVAFLLARDEAPVLARVMPRWSRLATVAVAVIAVSGGYQAWREIGSIGALRGTTYGQLVGVKVILFGVMLGFGYLGNRWVARRYRVVVAAFTAPSPATAGRAGGPGGSGAAAIARRTDVGLLRRSVFAESVIAVVVLVVTAVLVDVQPARTSYAPPFSRTVATGPLTVQVTVSPTRRGPETIHVYVFDDQGRVKTVEQVSGQLSLPNRGVGPFTVPFVPAAPGHAIASAVSVPFPGTWQFTAEVRVDDFDQYSATVTYQVR